EEIHPVACPRKSNIEKLILIRAILRCTVTGFEHHRNQHDVALFALEDCRRANGYFSKNDINR
ncbi:MAG TPA: hypothetical protein VFE08_07825, partial [Candidatus Sulfotelmatobacter sp.]|nr:hypothetical protein [Candidatus Sulfotelmatobacter sp.]